MTTIFYKDRTRSSPLSRSLLFMIAMMQAYFTKWCRSAPLNPSQRVFLAMSSKGIVGSAYASSYLRQSFWLWFWGSIFGRRLSVMAPADVSRCVQNVKWPRRLCPVGWWLQSQKPFCDPRHRWANWGVCWQLSLWLGFPGPVSWEPEHQTHRKIWCRELTLWPFGTPS